MIFYGFGPGLSLSMCLSSSQLFLWSDRTLGMFFSIPHPVFGLCYYRGKFHLPCFFASSWWQGPYRTDSYDIYSVYTSLVTPM